MTHLRIENQNSNVEIVSNSLILKLYTISSDIEQNLEELNLLNIYNQLEEKPLSDYITLKGNLLVDKCKESAYNYLTGNLPDSDNKRFPNLSINVTVGKYIDFADPEVERVLIANNIGDGNGVTTVDAASYSTGLGNLFSGNTTVTNINDLRYFTSIPWIGESFAKGATNLVSVNIPGNITKLSYTTANVDQHGAFKGCTKLASVTLNEGLQLISNSCFSGCTALTTINIPSTVLSIGTDDIIGRAVFYGCTSLLTVTGCSGVLHIGRFAFLNCSALTSINLSNVIDIAENGFNGCTSLSTIDLSNVATFGSLSFKGCTSLTLVDLSNCTTIQARAFQGCSNLQLVTLTNNLTTILANETFDGCTSLSSIDLSNIISIVGDRTFRNCEALTSVDISNAVISGEATFLNCSRLQSVILKSSLTTIPPYTFERCSQLASINLPSSVTSIGLIAFKNCTSLLSIDLSNVTSIGGTAFLGCSSLTSIDLSNVTSIGNEAFNWCTSLTSVNISSCTSLGYSVFKNCTGLTSVTLGNNITSIPKGMFYGCTNLSSIDLSNVTSINGDYQAEPFLNCTSLTTVNLSNVRHFGRGCFKGCSNLGLNLDLEITTTDTNWSGEEFQGTKYRTAVVHGPNLTTWISRGTYSSFYDMPNLTLLDLSDTVITNANSIGNGNNLVTIVYPSTLNYITWDAWNTSKSTFKYFIILATTPPSYENVTYCKLTNGNFYVPDDYVAAYKAAWPLIGYQSWNIHDHILPLSSLPVGVWKTGLYQLYEPYLSNSTDPAYATT